MAKVSKGIEIVKIEKPEAINVKAKEIPDIKLETDRIIQEINK
jgi:hypothetical protein